MCLLHSCECKDDSFLPTSFPMFQALLNRHSISSQLPQSSSIFTTIQNLSLLLDHFFSPGIPLLAEPAFDLVRVLNLWNCRIPLLAKPSYDSLGLPARRYNRRRRGRSQLLGRGWLVADDSCEA